MSRASSMRPWLAYRSAMVIVFAKSSAAAGGGGTFAPNDPWMNTGAMSDAGSYDSASSADSAIGDVSGASGGGGNGSATSAPNGAAARCMPDGASTAKASAL